jgi:hypothetical protein
MHDTHIIHCVDVRAVAGEGAQSRDLCLQCGQMHRRALQLERSECAYIYYQNTDTSSSGAKKKIEGLGENKARYTSAATSKLALACAMAASTSSKLRAAARCAG